MEHLKVHDLRESLALEMILLYLMYVKFDDGSYCARRASWKVLRVDPRGRDILVKE